jgi:hypothetical protein
MIREHLDHNIKPRHVSYSPWRCDRSFLRRCSVSLAIPTQGMLADMTRSSKRSERRRAWPRRRKTSCLADRTRR